MHIEVRSTYTSGTTGETVHTRVSPLMWDAAAPDFSYMAVMGDYVPGAVVAKFRCELKEDSKPTGWTRTTVQWAPTEQAIYDAIGLGITPVPIPIAGQLLHEGYGLGAVSTAWAYVTGIYTATCHVTYTKPNGTTWATDISAGANEKVLAVGGPLACGLQFSDSDRPFWDDGYRPNDPGFSGIQQEPWYLDIFADSPWIAINSLGQSPQRGKITLRYDQPEAVSAITWTFDGDPAWSAPWTNSTPQHVNAGALDGYRIISGQQSTNTSTGAIFGHANYSGAYLGSSFAFNDHSETCPPPGTFELNDSY